MSSIAGKTIMIVGGGPTQEPLLRTALDLGLRVVIADPIPTSRLVWECAQWVRLPANDLEGLRLACIDQKAEGILTTTMDSSVPGIGWLNERLGLRGVREAAGERAASKLTAKEAFLAAGVPTARHFTLPVPAGAPDVEVIVQDVMAEMEEKDFQWPVIVKPGRGASSQGVYKLDGADDARIWLADTCRWSGEFGADLLFEEFMVGREVSVEIVVVGTEPVILQLTDKTITPPPVCVEVGHLQPSTAWDDPQLLAQIREVAREAIRCLGLTDWPCHLELMITADGPKVVEINPRISGDTIGSHLVTRSTNVSFLELALRAVLGDLDRATLEAHVNSHRQCVAVRFVPPVAGKHFKALHIPHAEAIDAIVQYFQYGTPMGDFLSNYDRVAGTITVGPTREAVRSQLDRIFDGLRVECLEDVASGG